AKDPTRQLMPLGAAVARIPPGFHPTDQMHPDRAIILVDAGKLEGQPISRIADWIVGFTLDIHRNPKPGSCASLPTIADVFEPACPASNTIEEITAYDRAFLIALYR